eukprot:scaffold133305_cov26-Tisochrysis_lutea.AAC.1
MYTGPFLLLFCLVTRRDEVHARVREGHRYGEDEAEEGGKVRRKGGGRRAVRTARRRERELLRLLHCPVSIAPLRPARSTSCGAHGVIQHPGIV